MGGIKKESSSVVLTGPVLSGAGLFVSALILHYGPPADKLVFCYVMFISIIKLTPVSFMTVHKAKGLEADNILLLNFRNETLGFPNKIADDPLLGLVLTDSDDYPYAEERRLFYVALTRTRNKAYILVDDVIPSEFFQEFTDSEHAGIVHHDPQYQKETVSCPHCKTGHLVIRKNSSNHRDFLGCNNFPQCEYTVDDTSILRERRRCPKCGGFLIKRQGYNTFYGCSNYPFCRYTQNKI